MSARHTQELSVARAELQGARDRLVQLERCARTQFETEVKSLRQDRDMLRSKCDEKVSLSTKLTIQFLRKLDREFIIPFSIKQDNTHRNRLYLPLLRVKET